MSDASSTEEEKLVTIDANQLAELLGAVKDLSKEVDSLKNELEASRASGTVDGMINDSNRQEAVMHTLRRMNISKDVVKELRDAQTDKVVDLAADAAILNYKQHPPKHRM